VRLLGDTRCQGLGEHQAARSRRLKQVCHAQGMIPRVWHMQDIRMRSSDEADRICA
ncbi:MAG: hypothetical protein ACI88C_001917, partial [Acidimicrobiales bacterium]